MIAYSSISHMGSALLGIATRTTFGITGAIYMMLAYVTVFSCGTDDIRRQAARQDDGRFFILIMTGLGAFASIAAIVV